MKDRTKFSTVWVVVVVVMTISIWTLVEDAYGWWMGLLTYVLFWLGLGFGQALKWGIENT